MTVYELRLVLSEGIARHRDPQRLPAPAPRSSMRRFRASTQPRATSPVRKR
jgi:hypothetical protein